jgi:hypothetical protein
MLQPRAQDTNHLALQDLGSFLNHHNSGIQQIDQLPLLRTAGDGHCDNIPFSDQLQVVLYRAFGDLLSEGLESRKVGGEGLGGRGNLRGLEEVVVRQQFTMTGA